MDDSIVVWLFAMTLIVALGFGLYQYRKVTKARREGRRSVQAEVRGEPRTRPEAERR